MTYKRRRLDTVMLAVALFTISGAILAYNLRTIGSGALAVSLSDLASYKKPTVSAISDYSIANLTSRDSVFTASTPDAPLRSYELLDPIVLPPSE